MTLAVCGVRELVISTQAQSDAESEVEDFVRRHADTVYHLADSGRMGPDPTQDVVDAPLRVHRVQGMRGVDASVMPRIVSGNIIAPVIMVAENAAMFPGAGGRAARPHACAPGRCRADRARLG